MNKSEIKKLLISSLNSNSDQAKIAGDIEGAGISYDFSPGFKEKVLYRIFSSEFKLSAENEFAKYLNLAFSRIALSGVAAIAILLISIFLMEGSISFNSILGLNDNYNESIVCLLTGN